MTEGAFRPLLRDPAHVSVGGVSLVVPWAPASVWIRAIARGQDGIALDLAEEGRSDALRALAAGTLSLIDVAKMSHELLAAETGFKWFAAVRLIVTAAGGDVLGEMTLSGVDPERVSVGQWTAAAYRVLTKGRDEKQRLRFDFDLELPPEGYEDEWDDGDAGFAAMAALERKMIAERRANG